MNLGMAKVIFPCFHWFSTNKTVLGGDIGVDYSLALK